MTSCGRFESLRSIKIKGEMKMAKFKDVLIEALKRNGSEKMFSVNSGLMEVAKSTKKKPAFIKVAVDNESAVKFMDRTTYTSLILTFDGDMLNRIAAELDQNDQKRHDRISAIRKKL